MNSNYYGRKIVVSLIMNNIDWLAKMSKDTPPLDEIGIFVLSNILDTPWCIGITDS